MAHQYKRDTDLAMLPDPPAERAPNLRLLIFASVFLLVAIALLILRPGYDAQQTVAATDETQAPITLPENEPAVTRSDLSHFAAPDTPISQRLRQPILVQEQHFETPDLDTLAATVLRRYGHMPTRGDRLHLLLVDALHLEQSDAYIDALLNTAAARGEFDIPLRLRDTTGRLDTNRLLADILSEARN